MGRRGTYTHDSCRNKVQPATWPRSFLALLLWREEFQANTSVSEYIRVHTHAQQGGSTHGAIGVKEGVGTLGEGWRRSLVRQYDEELQAVRVSVRMDRRRAQNAKRPGPYTGMDFKNNVRAETRGW
eukprot:3009684-Pleurochrysis_carterae.AAC.7